MPRWLDKLLPDITIEPPHAGETHPVAAPSEAEPSKA
jgi:hypothetical protein